MTKCMGYLREILELKKDIKGKLAKSKYSLEFS